jgi:hypothetical protein
VVATLLAAAATLVAAAALVFGGLTLAASRSPRAALPVFLDLLMAAGLLRLGVADTWQAISTAALLVAARKLAVTGLVAGSSRGGSGGHQPVPDRRTT